MQDPDHAMPYFSLEMEQYQYKYNSQLRLQFECRYGSVPYHAYNKAEDIKYLMFILEEQSYTHYEQSI